MNRRQLEHLIRAASTIAKHRELLETLVRTDAAGIEPAE